MADNKAWREKNRDRLNSNERRRYSNNPDKTKIKEKNDAWKKANPEKCAASCKKWVKANLSKVAENKKRKYWNNTQFRLKVVLRSRLNDALKNKNKKGSAVALLGCSIAEAVQHLESQFQDGMRWENYGEWHIDHRKPLASFDLEDSLQLAEACHYMNLQPLWAVDNLKKGCRHVHYE